MVYITCLGWGARDGQKRKTGSQNVAPASGVADVKSLLGLLIRLPGRESGGRRGRAVSVCPSGVHTE